MRILSMWDAVDWDELGKVIDDNLILDDITNCLIWQGFVRKGYGIMGVGGRHRLVHRVNYFRHIGFTPLELHHTCDTKLCANVGHLQPLTSIEHRKIHRGRPYKRVRIPGWV